LAVPRLGESLIVAHQPEQRFFNIGWPGLSGLFQGLAPGRFAAAVNQAPMRRHGRFFLGDWLSNRIAVRQGNGLPAAHLLRSIFEHAADYAAAKKLLCESEIAAPAIFILAGIKDGEGCVIERTETESALREMAEDKVCAANHFESVLDNSGLGWRARPIDSAGRTACAHGLSSAAFGTDFGWFVPPIANKNSRLAFNAIARSGALTLMGTAGSRPTHHHLPPPLSWAL